MIACVHKLLKTSSHANFMLVAEKIKGVVDLNFTFWYLSIMICI